MMVSAQASEAFLVTVEFQVVKDAFRVFSAAQFAVVEHMSPVGCDVIKDMAGVSDDQA